jgi:hypothetical protein
MAYAALMICWSLNAYGLVFSWLKEGTLFARKLDGKPCVLDFVLYYEAAQLGTAARNSGVNIYDPKVQTEAVARLTAPVVPELPFFMQYPPLFFALCVPFAFFPLVWSWLLWSIAGVTSLLISIWALSGRHRQRCGLLIAASAALASYPVWLTVELGQTSLFLVASLSMFWLLLKEKRYFEAGLASFLLMVKVQYLPFLLLAALVLGRLRFAAGALVALVCAVLVSVLVLGWENCMEWPRVIFHAETTAQFGGVSPEHQQNIRGILTLLFRADTSGGRTTALLSFALACLAVAYLWTKPYAVLCTRTVWAFQICATVTLLTMLVFSLHTHIQDYSLLVIPALWLWKATDDPILVNRRQSKILRSLILAFPVLSWIFYLLRFVPAHSLQPFAMFALALLLRLLVVFWVPSKRSTA